MSRRTVILVPKQGLTIPDPFTGRKLPEAGQRKAMNSYWQRRIDEGSVTVKEEEKVSRGKN